MEASVKQMISKEYVQLLLAVIFFILLTLYITNAPNY